jgi:hypothetical protein
MKGGLEIEACERLSRILREVPFLHDLSFRCQTGLRDSRADFAIAISARRVGRRLVGEVKSSGQPRIAREACLLLLEMTRSDPRSYPVFVAPYISPQAASICESYNVGYLDFAGNCRLAFDQVYIRRDGYPNTSVQTRELRSLYSAKAERVLRALLTAGRRAWKIQELANEAEVSLGQVANVKKLLSDREWIKNEPAGFAFRSLGEAVLPLLQEWAVNYRASRNSSVDFYSLRSIPETEAELAAASRERNARLALTGFSGAARFAPAVRYQRISAYVDGEVEGVAERLGLKEVESGANVALIRPYDEGVFYGLREVEGSPVVSPVQLYLDLKQMRGRGEEAAAAMLREIIEPQWR